MSNSHSMQQLLVDKSLVIPTYQRDYAWTIKHVEDLLEDIAEAVTTGSSHYLGTVVLARNGGDTYEVVDGQQRLSTLTLVIQALLSCLPSSDETRIADTAILIRKGTELKLRFGNNAEFVSELLSGKTRNPETAGQRRIQAAFSHASDHAHALLKEGGEPLIRQWLDTIKRLEIIQFIATDTGKAIRLFQTVNDRGLPLSAMDKAKSLLVYYSSRFLDGVLDADVNVCFGRCFAAFDDMREQVKDPTLRIDTIAREAFSEDDLLRYHYLSYDYPGIMHGGDWDGTLRTVFEGFLKGTLKNFSSDSSKLRAFIRDYIEDFSAFCEAFRDLVLQTRSNPRIYSYLVTLGVSARLYPLTVRLQQRGLLFTTPSDRDMDLLQILETCDVRVYKTRGTNPAKDIGLLSHGSRLATAEQIADGVLNFSRYFMSDSYFSTLLQQDMYHNQALLRIMLEFDEQENGGRYSVDQFRALVGLQLTREHILSQTPSFDIQSVGFDDDEDFRNHKNLLGNLTPLTRSENSKCQNVNVQTKMTDPTLYLASHYISTRMLAQQFKAGTRQFNKQEILDRTKALCGRIISRWHL